MEREELLLHLRAAYRQGVKASVIANMRGMLANDLCGVATAYDLRDNDFAATLHLRKDTLTECQFLSAQSLALCVRWQESEVPDDDLAERIFATAHWAISVGLRVPMTAYRKSQSARRKGNGKISNVVRNRIKRVYAERLHNGQKYGAIKALASEHAVSASTIKGIVKKLN